MNIDYIKGKIGIKWNVVSLKLLKFLLSFDVFIFKLPFSKTIFVRYAFLTFFNPFSSVIT